MSPPPTLTILRGACSCGRNRFVIDLPSTPAPAARAYFDNSRASRQTHAAPLAAYLLVPLPWYRSSTFAYAPDETHTAIRRTYHDHDDGAGPAAARQWHFCGFCGSQLARYEEHETKGQGRGDGESEAGTISVALGSLLDEDQDVLEELGLLPGGIEEEDEEEEEEGRGAGEGVTSASPALRGGASSMARREEARPRGAPWFEEMVEDSRLGRVRRRRGGHARGRQAVEWEVVEVEGPGHEETGDERPGSGLKRKVEQVARDENGDGDVQMR